jgi:hypothetical protein
LTLAAAGAVLAIATMVTAVPAQASITSTPAAAVATPRLTTDTNAPCNTTPAPGFARCFAIVHTTSSHEIAAATSGQPPSGTMSPADIQSAYKLPASGTGQTVAIVDAYGDSNAESDLATYRTQYGLSVCTTANGCFRKVDQTGGTNYPADDASWGLETTLDLDAVSAACPNCHILLVEANSNSDSDLAAAEDEAVSLGAKFISNSYGETEDAAETSDASAYDHPGVAVVVAAGDTGNVVEWPSSDPDVTAVGGTTLTQDASVARGWDETAWSSGGSGCSTIEPKPAYQVGISTDCAMRATSDVAADANPESGLAIYDTLGQTGWLQVGGTSLATPLITAVYAMAGTPTTGTYPVNYPYHDPNQSTDMFDITQGTNGSCGDVLCTAGTGWDGPTGLGTPDGLGAFSSGGPEGEITGQVTDAATGKPVADAQVTANPGNYAATTDAQGDYTLDVNAGTYTVTSSMYAFQDGTDTGVTATANQTTTANLSMAELPHSVVTGTVRDGSGHGWPLYAQITIGGGYPGGPVYTNPATGEYSVTLAGPATYPIQISAADPTVTGEVDDGYQTVSASVTAGTTPQTQNYTLPVDTSACTALGYGPRGLTENFSTWQGSTPADGWSVDGTGWRFDNPGNRPPPGDTTTGNGTFAVADSGTSGGSLNTTLTSPSVDLSGQSAPNVTFQSGYYGARGQQAEVELSTDGGSRWQTIWRQTTGDAVGSVSIPIPQAAGKQDVRVRFGYTGHDAWWWTVGDVTVGTAGCAALPGGLVTGYVSSGTTPIDAATITAAADSGVSAITTGAPNGTGAIYTLFSPATGKQAFTATASGYGTARATVNVASGAVTEQDWSLTPATTSTASTAAAPATAAPTDQAATGKASDLVLLPGLHGKSYTVTLITGDQVQLTASGRGYTLRAVPASATSQGLTISGLANSSGTSTLTALPAGAADLLASGQLNRGLFDLAWLVRHGDTGTGSVLHLELSYAGHPDAAALTSAASALPGVTVTATSAASGTAQVSLSAGKAAAFWAAITARGQLTSDISGIALADHQLSAAVSQPQTTSPLYTVTETITGQAEGASCSPTSSLCFISPLSLSGMSGEGANQVWPDSGISCVVTNSSGLCTSYQVVYSVPAGVYTANGSAAFNIGQVQQELDLTIPQITVAGDTSVSVNLADARQITIKTPRPSFNVGLTTEDYRLSPEGGLDFTVAFHFYTYQNEWVVRAGEPVTVGTYDYSSDWIRDAPTLSVSVTGGNALDAVYPYYASTSATPFATFSGRKTYQVVDAGIGSAADFSAIDARGKLAIIKMDPVIGGCIVESSQLTNALNAGAVGVLIDPTLDPSLGDGPYCPEPLYPDWFYPGIGPGKVVNIPFAEIPQAQADALRTGLSHGPVSVTVTDSGTAAYQYDVKFYSEGGQPADPDYTVGGRDLTPIETTYSSPQPDYVDTGDTAFNPNEFLGAGVDDLVVAQTRQTEYYGPTSPAVVWSRTPELNESGWYQDAWNVFSGTSGSSDDWFSQPEVPGAATFSQAIVQAQPGTWDNPGSNIAACAFCRQDNTFYPLTYEISGADPALFDNPWLFENDITLSSGGKAIQPALVDGFVSYPLSAARARYQLSTTLGPTFTGTQSTVTTDWQFSSGESSASAPLGYACVGTALAGVTGSCAPQPLILLKYNAFTCANDDVTAGHRQQIEVTPYFQAGAAQPSITSLTLSVSFDHGKTWQKVTVRAHDGSYQGSYQVPALSATGGTVTIKAQASDSAGDTVSQTVLDGYGITG